MSEPFLDVVRRSWLLFSVLVLLLGMVGWSLWTQHKLVGRVAAMENTLSGKMSSEWEDRLKNLEAQVANSNQWPEDADETKRFFDDVSVLGTSLSAWADANYLPRLNLVRWASLAFNHLNGSQNSDALLNDLARAEEVRSLADAKPDGDASNLDQRLQEKADWIENQQIDKAVEWAEQYLKKDANTQQDSTEAGPDIESIYEFLGQYENNPAQNDQERNKIASLRKKLESKFHREVEDQQDKDRRAYQRWALREIREFEEKFRNVIKEAGQVSEKTKEYGWLSLSRWTEEMWAWIEANFHDQHYKAIKKAMISHLLPIDLALLELPVLKLYRQTFDKGWALLDGREEQNGVAESSAVTAKKSLRAILEGQS